MKQTAHLYYWFLVTTVFLYEFNGTFHRVCVVLCPEKCLEILNFSCPEFFLLNPGLMHTKNGKTWSVTAAVVDFT